MTSLLWTVSVSWWIAKWFQIKWKHTYLKWRWLTLRFNERPRHWQIMMATLLLRGPHADVQSPKVTTNDSWQQCVHIKSVCMKQTFLLPVSKSVTFFCKLLIHLVLLVYIWTTVPMIGGCSIFDLTNVLLWKTFMYLTDNCSFSLIRQNSCYSIQIVFAVLSYSRNCFQVMILKSTLLY